MDFSFVCYAIYEGGALGSGIGHLVDIECWKIKRFFVKSLVSHLAQYFGNYDRFGHLCKQMIKPRGR